MRREHRGRVLAAAMLVVLAQPAAAVEADAEKIQACMRANIPKTLQIKEVELTATDRTGGERTLRGKLYGTNEDGKLRAMLRIGAPVDLAGAGYLLREGKKPGTDEMYVYVPALNKVRRITGASVDGSLWGTDLSYSDVKQIQNAFAGAATKLEGNAAIEASPVRVISFQPSAAEGTRYTTIRAWVDQKTCVPLKVEFHEGATVRKRMTVAPRDLKQAGAYWYASDLLMSDVKGGTKTRVKVLGVTSDKDLADRYFNPSTFYVGN